MPEFVTVKVVTSQVPAGWDAVAIDAQSGQSLALGFADNEDDARAKALMAATNLLIDRGWRYAGITDEGSQFVRIPGAAQPRRVHVN
jgi:hypothetical protein